MNILAILILWTWGLTPSWVNLVGTVIFGVRIVIDIINAYID